MLLPLCGNRLHLPGSLKDFTFHSIGQGQGQGQENKARSIELVVSNDELESSARASIWQVVKVQTKHTAIFPWSQRMAVHLSYIHLFNISHKTYHSSDGMMAGISSSL